MQGVNKGDANSSCFTTSYEATVFGYEIHTNLFDSRNTFPSGFRDFEHCVARDAVSSEPDKSGNYVTVSRGLLRLFVLRQAQDE